MKKFISLILLLSVMVLPKISMADYTYEKTSSEMITDSVTYKEFNLLSSSGWIRAYTAFVDLESDNSSLKVLTSSKGVSYLSTVRNMAKESGARLTINGDFFNVRQGQTNMLGMTVSEGELLSSPALDNMVSFAITDEKEIIMDYFSHCASVTSPQGYVHPIYQINKLPVTTGAITMLTDKWAPLTPEGFDVLMVSSDGLVQKRLSASSSAELVPEDSYILVTNYEINGFFDNFSVGDEVKIETVLTPDAEKIKEATGGNTLLVSDGKMAEFTNNVTGRAQRSSIGVTKDGKTLILAVTDGRGVTVPGLTQEEMANLMIHLGADRAINLDGGGSSTFTVQNADGTFANKNSVSYERPVSTAIGIFSDKKYGETAVRGEIIPSQSVILEGDSVSFDVKFYDKYDNLFPYINSSLKLYDENGNNVNIKSYTAEKGNHKIYASLNGTVAECEIKVIDSLSSIELSNEKVNIEKGKSHTFKVYGYGENGEKTLIDPTLVQWFSLSENAQIKNGTLTLADNGGAIVGVRYKGVTDYAVINKSANGLKPFLPEYKKDVFEGSLQDGKKVAVSGDVPKGATLLNRLFSISRLNEIEKYDKAYISASDFSEKLPQNIKISDSYSETIIENTAFVTLNTKNGYLSSGSDWNKLYKVLSSDVKNVVITSSLSPDNFDDYEEKMMKEILKQSADSGKQIFWVSSGETPSVKKDGSVIYIQAGTVTDYKKESINDNIPLCAYVVFSVNGDEIKFEFKE